MTGLASSSARREYGLLRALFAVCARDWGWLKDSPFAKLSPPAEGQARSRRVSDDDADALITALGYVRGARPETASQYVAVAFLLAIETAMRQGEMLSADRRQITGRVLTLPKTKNGDARYVPLSTAALALLDLLPTEGYLFPVASSSADSLFRKARKRTGLLDIHFHDSRREGITRLAAKVDVMLLAKISGHKDVKLLLRVYYAPSMDEVADRLG